MTAENFYKELQRLILSHPKRNSHNVNSENCDYGDQLYYCKNMLYCFDCTKSADCIYGSDIFSSIKNIDCDYLDRSELCYECVDCRDCFNSNYLEYCSNVSESAFSYNCTNCNDIFGCANLKNKSYCIFNRQLTEDEYRQQITKYKTISPAKLLEMLEGIKKKYPLTQTRGLNNQNSPYGNNIDNSKDCYLCFDSSDLENCGYLYDSGESKYSYDAAFSSNLELSYETIDSSNLFNCDFSLWSGNCQDSSYMISCVDSKNCLGCVNITHKEYCILNRQFTKEEYEKIAPLLLKELREKNLGWADLVF